MKGKIRLGVVFALLLGMFLGIQYIPRYVSAQTWTPSPAFDFTNITSNTTTVLRTGHGILHVLVVNTKGGTGNTATIYDNTTGSGTKIGIVATDSKDTFLQYDVQFQTGLTIVTATGTAPDITVGWRTLP